jgi:hypothetical protein
LIINKTLKNYTLNLLIFVIVLFQSLSVSSQETASNKSTLPFFKANYDALIEGFSVKAYREYKPLENGLFELNFTATSWLASLSETSQFSWKGQNINPKKFYESRNILGIKKASQLDFNHNYKTLSRTIENEQKNLSYVEDSLDRLSFQLQLQQDLFLNKPNITYNIVHNDNIKKNQFEIVGEEIISTKAGDFKTLKIKVVRENTSRITFIWVALDWQYLLVRLVQLKNDKEQFSIEVTDATVNNLPVVGLQL